MTEKMTERFLTARKNYIAAQFPDLNSKQREAVLTTQGPLLLLAGAGSGKTTVLINRIANIIRFGCASDSTLVPDTISQQDVEFLENLGAQPTETEKTRAQYICAVDPPAPWQVMAITFTNKAANELKNRLETMLGAQAQDVWAMTFHAACCRILRRDIGTIGFTTSFTIYDTADSERVMKEIIRDMGLDDKTFPPRYVLTVISREKDQMIDPDQMLNRVMASSDARLLPIAKAYKTYQTRLRENNALDFDDIIFYTVRLLQENKDILRYYQNKFRYVLVDEYQDTNHMQYLLTSLLSGGHKNICVVGDDDQSIYRFRGATIENILSFEQQYRGARTIRLEQNYRSTQSILNAANAVIAHNIGRKGKQLWTANGGGEPICVYEAGDESAEANFVAGQIINNSKGHSFKDYAILYRTNAQSNALEFALKRSGIAYRVIGGTRFFDRAEIKDMLSYLCVIHNRNDDLRLQRIINNPPRGLGAKAMDEANRLAQSEGKGLYNVISDPDSYAPLERVAGKFRNFCDIIESLASLLDNGMSLADFYEEVMERTGYRAMLEMKPTEENKTRLENIRELKSSIISYMESAEAPSLDGFLEEIALYTDIEEYNASDDAVVLMTMHAAKGLEFPHVFLVGFEEGIFPGMRAIGDNEELEEERRLCYVAITRAKRTLTISHARQRMLYGRTNAYLRSRFLDEIPDNLVNTIGGYSAPRTYQTGTHTAAPRQPAAYKPPVPPMSQYTPKPQTPTLNLNKGDMVEHAAFGRGMVLSVLKMGNDALLEIAFDEKGTKKLMAKTASQHMKRL